MSTFYEIKQLSIEEKTNLLRVAKDNSLRWWVDKLDCSQSWARQRVDMGFDEIMTKFDRTCHYVVIDRGFDHFMQEDYFEVGFSTMTQSVNFYLFIHLSKIEGEKLVNTFNLKPWKA